jgi:UDP-N-acetylglucosamine--N-acetylmuramyl-(pentapeptide) pyrophosphoryl-undecaprenol N-acetylglucosamine transferase
VRVVITGGGTGGHLFPGIAVAEELKQRDEAIEVIFIGTEKGIESKVIPKEGYPIRYLKVEGVLGKNPLKKVSALWRLLSAVFASKKLFRAAMPDIVIGTGGFVSVGPVVAARLMSIPTLILEQNLMPGMANRMLGRIVDSVAVTYHDSMSFFSRGKARIMGNPIRKGILSGRKEEALKLFSLDEGKTTVLILGGSRGARSINSAMLGALNHLLDLKEDIQFLHQTGEEDYETVRKMYRQMGFTAMVAPFVYQMPEAYALADIVVSRAGATTLAEITAIGKAAILIPYQYAAGHQELNARKLHEMGGCRIIDDNKLSADVLAGSVREVYGSEEARDEMCRQSRALGRPDAAQRVVDIAMSLVRMRRGNV